MLQLEKMRTARTTADNVTVMRNVESIKLYVMYRSSMTRADCSQLPRWPVHNTCSSMQMLLCESNLGIKVRRKLKRLFVKITLHL